MGDLFQFNTGLFTDVVLLKNFYYWINERHRIYLRRLAGEPGPWTGNPVLRDYKFTNPFRENDRETIWMRKHWTGPNEHQPWGIQIFNCCFFRMFGTSDFAGAHGYVTDWDPEHTRALATQRLNNREKVFTGAYIITNQGLKDPKQNVVVDLFLKPIWENRERLVEVARNKSLQDMHTALKLYRGWGSGGFMAYEAVTDLNYTPVLRDATDRYEWANAGPGAMRGLNRLLHRKLDGKIPKDACQRMMYELMRRKVEFLEDHVPLDQVDMRCIEHSLCEWDKYQRTINGEGAPRGRFSVERARELIKGPV